MKDWFFPLFFLITLFSDYILFSGLLLAGKMVESGMMVRLIMPLSIISYMILLVDLKHITRKRNNVIVLISLAFIGVSYYLTSLFQLSIPSGNMSHFLKFCSMSVAATVLGIHAGIYPSSLKRVDTLLPFFVLFTGLVLGSLGYTAASAGTMVDREETGISYQRIAYVMAEIFSYSVYYLFFSTARNTTLYKIMRWPMVFMCFFSILVCLMSGGRGAFVTMILLGLFVLYIMIKSHRISYVALSSIIVITAGVIILLIIKLNVMETIGFLRISERLTEDPGRLELYNKAWRSIENSYYMGSGLGSVWWEVGFYSHNMFLDMLVEIGIIGTAIVLYVLYKMIKKLLFMCKIDLRYMFLLLILLQNLVHTIFSGYWISSYQLWIVYGFVFSATSVLKPLRKNSFVGYEVSVSIR